MSTEYTEYERAKINLENLRNELALYTRDRDHANNLIDLRKRDIERAEEHLKWAKYPVYDHAYGGARRVYHVDAKWITLRYDLGRLQEFRMTDGQEKGTHHGSGCGDQINVAKAMDLWTEYLAQHGTNVNIPAIVSTAAALGIS